MKNKGQLFSIVITTITIVIVAAAVVFGLFKLVQAHGERVNYVMSLTQLSAKPFAASQVMLRMHDSERTVAEQVLDTLITQDTEKAKTQNLPDDISVFMQGYGDYAKIWKVSLTNRDRKNETLSETSSLPNFCGNLDANPPVIAYYESKIHLTCQRGRTHLDDLDLLLYRCCREDYNFQGPVKSFAPKPSETVISVDGCDGAYDSQNNKCVLPACGINQEGVCVGSKAAYYTNKYALLAGGAGGFLISPLFKFQLATTILTATGVLSGEAVRGIVPEQACAPGREKVDALGMCKEYEICCKPLDVDGWLQREKGLTGAVSLPFLWRNDSFSPGGIVGYLNIEIGG